MLRKLKSVVKLQAAFRGHLVRRQAFGTLRCIQAIIRMQALVRARRVQLVESLTFSEDTKFQVDNQRSTKILTTFLLVSCFFKPKYLNF